MVFSSRKLWTDTKLRFLITGLTSIPGNFQDTMSLWMFVSLLPREQNILIASRFNSMAMSENTRTHRASKLLPGKVVKS